MGDHVMVKWVDWGAGREDEDCREGLCYLTSTRSNASITTVPISSHPRMRSRKAVTSVGLLAPKWYSSMAPSGWFATRSQTGSTVPQSLQRTSLPESITGSFHRYVTKL